MPNKLDRREFMKLSSLSTMSMLHIPPVMAGLIKNYTDEQVSKDWISIALRLTDDSTLQNLEFYFINVFDKIKTDAGKSFISFTANDTDKIKEHRKKDEIKKTEDQLSFQQESYMIVRLPQQHIAEQYFLAEMDPDAPCNTQIAEGENECPAPKSVNSQDAVYAQTRIAGYSYLAFRITKSKIAAQDIYWGIEVSTKSLLDWNNAGKFELIVRRYINQPIFEISYDDKGNGKPIRYFNQNIYTPSIQSSIPENQYPLGYRSGSDPNKGISFHRKNFPKYRSTLNDPSPITAIEAPYGLILCPELPNQHDFDFKWLFSGNKSLTNGSELWMATLRVSKIEKKEILKSQGIDTKKTPNNNASAKRQAFANSEVIKTNGNEGDDLMRIMIIGSPDHMKKPENKVELNIWSGQDKEFSCNYLPRHFDRKDLVDLYILYKLHARTSKLSFTPLGICTALELTNERYAENKIPLYEWKHLISFGRDQEVKVSTVVMDACFGLKMLYIETTARVTKHGISFLEYKTFLMPLETEKSFNLYNNEENINEYQVNNYKSNTPFKKVKFVDDKAKPVRPFECLDPVDITLREGSTEKSRNTTLAFWAKTFEKNEYQEWEFICTDWHDNEIRLKKKMFLLTSLLTLNDQTGSNNASKAQVSTTKINLPDLGGFDTIDSNIKKNISFREGDTTTTEFEAFCRRLSKEFRTVHTSARTWGDIYSKSEQLLLIGSDLYRNLLEKKWEEIDRFIRAGAGELEDEVVENYLKLKEKLLDQAKQFSELIGQEVMYLQAQLGIVLNIIQHESSGTLGTITDDEKLLIASLANTSRCLHRETLTSLEVIKEKILQSADTAIIIAINNACDAVAYIQQKLADETDESLSFYTNLPDDLVKNIKTELDKKIVELREILRYIETTESYCKSKINLAKNKIGYAVYYVEEELAELKEKLQQNLNDKWQDAYEKMKDEYNKFNKQVSELETEYVVFKNNFRKYVNDEKDNILNFFDPYACFPQLHSAKVHIKSVNDLVHKDIPMKIKYAAEYFKNQLDDLHLNIKNNSARVFAEIHQEAKQALQTAIRHVGNELGGIINPEIAADYITYLKNPINEAKKALNDGIDDLKNEAEDLKESVKGLKSELEKDFGKLRNDLKNEYAELKDEVLGDFQRAYNQGRNQLLLITKEAKEQYETARSLVTGAKKQAEEEVNAIKDRAIVEAKAFFKGLEAKIIGSIRLQDILGIDFEPPKLDRDRKSIYYNFVTNSFKNVELGPFKFVASPDTSLRCFFEKPLTNGSYTAWTKLENFDISIFDERLVISFNKLQITSTPSAKNKVSVDIGDVQFKKELAFLQSLSKNIEIPGTGILLNITPKGIEASFSYGIPGISGGAFTFNNLKFMIGVGIPFPSGGNILSPLEATFGINSPDDKFVIAAGIFGGRGHFVIKTTPKYIKSIDCSLEFGGYIGLDLVIAKGEAFLMAGIRYVYKRDPMGKTSMEFYAYITCGGSVTAFGFITVSVLFMVCLRYQQYNGSSSLYGTASVSYSIKIGFFKKSFTLTFSKRLQGTDQQSTAKNDTPVPWHNSNNAQLAHYVIDENSAIFYNTGFDNQEEDKKRKRKKILLYTEAQWIKFCSAYAIN